jgi:hypothetical protein
MWEKRAKRQQSIVPFGMLSPLISCKTVSSLLVNKKKKWKKTLKNNKGNKCQKIRPTKKKKTEKQGVNSQNVPKF